VTAESCEFAGTMLVVDAPCVVMYPVLSAASLLTWCEAFTKIRLSFGELVMIMSVTRLQEPALSVGVANSVAQSAAAALHGC
jgi:hypothetical protein